nr:putative gustatory receptor 28b isoform X3 [Cherax quadricarinatus]
MKGQIMIDMLLNKFFFLLSFVTSLTVIILIHPGASAMGRLYLQLSKVDTLIPYEAGEAPGKENQIGWYLRHQGMLLLAIMALLNMSGILIMLQSKVYPEEDEVDVLQVANLLLFSLGLLLAVYLLSAAVDYLRVQHERTSELVHRFRTDSGKVCTAWLSSVQLFSLQLLHSSPQFRVAGFFSIDRSFLLAMIGNLATYLVILLQFRDTNSANCSTATKDANRTIV